MKLPTAIILTLLSTAALAFADWPPHQPNQSTHPMSNLDPIREREKILHDNRTTSTVVFGPRGDKHTCRTQHIGGNPVITDCE